MRLGEIFKFIIDLYVLLHYIKDLISLIYKIQDNKSILKIIEFSQSILPYSYHLLCLAQHYYASIKIVFSKYIINQEIRKRKTFIILNRNLTIKDSFNISSVTDCGSGICSINLTAPLNDSEYYLEVLSDNQTKYRVLGKSKYGFTLMFDAASEQSGQISFAVA